METENKKNELKHLGFVRLATIHAFACVSNLYDYAKQNSGPLRSVVGTVESAVTTVVGPVYHKLEAAPHHLLVFLDRKVDEASHKFDEHAPSLAKYVVGQAQALICKTSEKVQMVVDEARKRGPRAAVHCVASETKEVIVNTCVHVWGKLNKYPIVQSVANIAVPTAAHWSEKYNCAVKEMSYKGYTVFSYFPVIPLHEMANAFKRCEVENKKGERHSDSDSDSE